MNGTPFPYMNNPYNQIPPPQLEQELIKIKKEIEKINRRLQVLENKEKKDYLQKDDGLYMM